MAVSVGQQKTGLWNNKWFLCCLGSGGDASQAVPVQVKEVPQEIFSHMGNAISLLLGKAASEPFPRFLCAAGSSKIRLCQSCSAFPSIVSQPWESFPSGNITVFAQTLSQDADPATAEPNLCSWASCFLLRVQSRVLSLGMCRFHLPSSLNLPSCRFLFLRSKEMSRTAISSE